MQKRKLQMAVMALVFLAGCKQAVSVPDLLIGEWRTEAPKYADRSLVITSDQLIFGTGNGNVDVKRIVRVDELREEQGISYTIYYGNPGEPEYRLILCYEERGGGVIRLKNQNQIEWTKGGL
ncbi:MAG: hypothetical protein V3V49_09065 [Candidatus Krumholzibacteria bacterium]